MNINQQYMYMLRFKSGRCVFLLFLCVDETYYFICVNTCSDAIKLPKSYSHPPPLLVGRGYRLSHFCLAKEVEKRSCSNSAYKNHKIL